MLQKSKFPIFRVLLRLLNVLLKILGIATLLCILYFLVLMIIV